MTHSWSGRHKQPLGALRFSICPELELPFVMLYSRAIGVGAGEATSGTSIRRAHATPAQKAHSSIPVTF